MPLFTVRSSRYLTSNLCEHSKGVQQR